MKVKVKVNWWNWGFGIIFSAFVLLVALIAVRGVFFWGQENPVLTEEEEQGQLEDLREARKIMLKNANFFRQLVVTGKGCFADSIVMLSHSNRNGWVKVIPVRIDSRLGYLLMEAEARHYSTLIRADGPEYKNLSVLHLERLGFYANRTGGSEKYGLPAEKLGEIEKIIKSQSSGSGYSFSQIVEFPTYKLVSPNHNKKESVIALFFIFTEWNGRR